MPKEVPTVTWEEDKIDFFGTDIPVYLPNTISKYELETLSAFVNWKATLHANLKLQESKEHAFHKHPYSLRSIEIKSVTKFPNGKVGFIKIDAAVECEPLPDGNLRRVPLSLPGTSFFLKGGSAAMLIILRPRGSRDERYVILTEQTRLAAGSLKFLEIPAGLLDDTHHFAGAVAKEIEEEIGFKIPMSELINMTELALGDADHQETSLQKAMYPSPATCDEYIALFLWEKELDRQEIEDLHGRLTEERSQNEFITLHVVEYEGLWRAGARDSKTLAAWALYEGLNRSDGLQRYRRRIRESHGSAYSHETQG